MTSETSYLEAHSGRTALARDYLDRLLRGDRREAGRLVLEEVEAGMDLKDVYLDVFQPVLWEVGRLWEINEITVAEEHYCTAATQLVMSQLYPHLFGGERSGLSMVATCVGGDLHEIGVRMVSDFFEMDGWDTLYLGANTPAEDIAMAVEKHGAHLLALSVTLDSHLDAAREALDAVDPLRQRGLKVLVGGAPFRTKPELWSEIGADGFGRDAREAVEVGLGLVVA